jgi:hypothetical protein
MTAFDLAAIVTVALALVVGVWALVGIGLDIVREVDEDAWIDCYDDVGEARRR